jgi:hypothetical protein
MTFICFSLWLSRPSGTVRSRGPFRDPNDFPGAGEGRLRDQDAVGTDGIVVSGENLSGAYIGT